MDGVYQIANAGNLYWFAQYVNNGNTAANALLTADILVNKNVLASDGTLGGVAGYNFTFFGDGVVTNCYYLDTCGAGGSGTRKTAEQFASGEVVYLLNGYTSEGDLAWYQTIGTDSYPTLDGEKVYQVLGCDGESVAYSNTDAPKNHSYENGSCVSCGVAGGPVELKIVQQPTDGEAKLGESFCVTVEATGEGLRYQWYYRNAGSDKWCRSSQRESTYDDVMTAKRADREIYCVITDAWGNKVTTEIVKLICAEGAQAVAMN